MLPDPIPEPLPAGPRSSYPTVQQVVDAECTLRHCDDRMREALTSELRRHYGVLMEFDAATVGRLEREMPDVWAVLEKMQDKVGKRLYDLQSEVYQHQLSLGMPIPSDEEVLHHAATGRLIVPPTESLPATEPEATVQTADGATSEVSLAAGSQISGSPVAPVPVSPVQSVGLAPAPEGWHYVARPDGSPMLVRSAEQPAVPAQPSQAVPYCGPMPHTPPPDGYRWVCVGGGPWSLQKLGTTVDIGIGEKCVMPDGGQGFINASGECSPLPPYDVTLSGGGGGDTITGGGGGGSGGGGSGGGSGGGGSGGSMDVSALCRCLADAIRSAFSSIPDTIKVSFDEETCLHTAPCPPESTSPCPTGSVPCPMLADGTSPGGCCCPPPPTATSIWAVTARCIGEDWQLAVIDVSTKPQLASDTVIDSWWDDQGSAQQYITEYLDTQSDRKARFGVCGTISVDQIPLCPGGTKQLTKGVSDATYWVCVACCGSMPAVFILKFDSTGQQATVPLSTRVWKQFATYGDAQTQAIALENNPRMISDAYGNCINGDWLKGGGGPGTFGWPDWSKINWGDPAICKLLADVESLLNQLTPVKLSVLFGLRDDGGLPIVPPWLKSTFSGSLEWVGKSLADMFRGILEGTWTALNNVPMLGSCQIGRVGLAVLARGLVSAAEKWLGIDLAEYHGQFGQLVKYLCPYEIPSVAELDEMRKNGRIDEATWTCLVKANGVYPSWAELTYQQGTYRPSPEEAYSARVLGRIDQSTFNDAIDHNGLRTQSLYDAWKGTRQELPSMGDLITFMLRDTFDTKTIDWTQADAEGQSKITTDLQKYMSAIFADPELFKHRWRAHYNLPSASQLYEMLHRLRGDPAKDPLAVDKALVKATLGQNDVAPQWRDRLVAISYKPLTRTDAQRAFFIDSLGEKELLNAYLDLGYEKQNAQYLVDFSKQLKLQRQQNHRIFRLYKRGGLPRAKAEQLCIAAGMDAQQYTQQLDWLDVEKEAQANRECLKEVKHNVVGGLTNAVENIADVQALGYSALETNRILKEYECVRNQRSKVMTAAKLCEWYQWGLMTPREHYDALRRLNYSDDDAQRIVKLCHTKLTGEDVPPSMFLDTQPLPKRKRKAPAKPTGDVYTQGP